MRQVVGLIIVIMCAVLGVSAQTTKRDRKQYAEDKNVTLRVDRVVSVAPESFSPHTAYSYALDDYKPGVVRVGPRTTYLKEGLTTDEVIKLMGKPTAISQRNDKDVKVTVYEFRRGDDRMVVAEFENGRLARSHTEQREKAAEADR